VLTLLWFDQDLRLDDNPALAAAAARGPVVPVYILDEAAPGPWAPGAAARWWLHGALAALGDELQARGTALVLRRGAAAAVIDELLASTGADAVYWNRRYEPWAMRRAEGIKGTLRQRGIEARSFNAGLLSEPGRVLTQKGEPFRVFTPFWRALRAQGEWAPHAPAPARLVAAPRGVASDALDDWHLRPSQPDWANGLREHWQPGAAGAQARLDAFVAGPISAYTGQRNLPGTAGTSRLSPHLHAGEIGPRQVWRAACLAAAPAGAARGRDPADDGGEGATDGRQTYLAEIAWREFSYHLLFHFPQLPLEPLRPEFAAFPWDSDPAALRAWQRGRTGYPIVDAGMRELWHTGWMHNRVRMIVASFLVKDLLLDWRSGAEWFWDTLVDADLASNAASWQWVAGCGADAAPYFRVFNPSLQGAKFDPDGAYVRHWVPELARLPAALLHAPWEARPVDLAAAGVVLGRDYPAPMVDHAQARHRALWAYEQIRKR
jgi:deoxyribodipyrimidine photo-lyase